jgi:ribosomal protein L7/L12
MGTDDLRNSILHGMHLLQAIKREVGDDAAIDAFNALQTILGRTWSGAIIFARMQGASTKFVTFTDMGINGQKISAIKEIRRMTAFGLKDAKDIVDQVQAGRPYTFDFSKNTDDEIIQFVSEMQTFGCTLSYT